MLHRVFSHLFLSLNFKKATTNTGTNNIRLYSYSLPNCFNCFLVRARKMLRELFLRQVKEGGSKWLGHNIWNINLDVFHAGVNQGSKVHARLVVAPGKQSGSTQASFTHPSGLALAYPCRRWEHVTWFVIEIFCRKRFQVLQFCKSKKIWK